MLCPCSAPSPLCCPYSTSSCADLPLSFCSFLVRSPGRSLLFPALILAHPRVSSHIPLCCQFPLLLSWLTSSGYPLLAHIPLPVSCHIEWLSSPGSQPSHVPHIPFLCLTSLCWCPPYLCLTSVHSPCASPVSTLLVPHCLTFGAYPLRASPPFASVHSPCASHPAL